MKIFSPPSLKEILEYFVSNDFYNATLEAEKFYDYNLTVGWIVGKKKTKMVDWQAACRTWNRNAKQYATEHGKKIPQAVKSQSKKAESKQQLPSKEEVKQILGKKYETMNSLFSDHRVRTNGAKPLTELLPIEGE